MSSRSSTFTSCCVSHVVLHFTHSYSFMSELYPQVLPYRHFHIHVSYRYAYINAYIQSTYLVHPNTLLTLPGVVVGGEVGRSVGFGVGLGVGLGVVGLDVVGIAVDLLVGVAEGLEVSSPQTLSMIWLRWSSGKPKK